MSRRITDLIPPVQEKFLLFQSLMEAAGINFIVTSTLRTQEEQNALYAQGRTKPGKIVTWTRNSRHASGRAFDITILINGKLCWNPELDADGDGISEYTEAGNIGKLIGLEWGGDFMHVDACHFELS